MLERNNQGWVEQLRGKRGRQLQKLAHQELAVYLYRIVYHYLVRRQSQPNPYMLVNLTRLELAALAQQFVQEVLEKVACHDFLLLDEFKGEGSFTSWIAAVAARDVAQKLCHFYWKQEGLPEEEVSTHPKNTERLRSHTFEKDPQRRLSFM